MGMLQNATGVADEGARKMIQEAAEAMADWTKKEEQYRQMIKALEDQVRDITNVYNKQWVEEKNEILGQLFQKSKMEQDAIVRDAQEALAAVVQQRDVKENELQGQGQN